MKKKIILIALAFSLVSNILFGVDRVVSLTLSGDEILLGLGQKNKMIGVSSGIVDDERFSNIVGELSSYEKIQNNLEKIVNLNPEIVIVASWISVDMRKHLENIGIETLTYSTPKSFDELIANIEKFENRLGTDKKLSKVLKDKVEQVKQKTLKVENKKSVLLYSGYGTTDGFQTMFDDISRIGNFENIVNRLNLKGNISLSKEKIIELNPDIIIVPTYSEDDEKRILESIFNDKSLSGVEAIKNKKVYGIEEKHLITSSQYAIKSLEEIVKKVYPNI